MTKIKLNLDDVGGFEPIPAGDYEAYLYEAKPTTFRSGNEGFALTFKIADGEYKGRQIFDNIVLTEKAYWKLGQFWRAITNDEGIVDIDTNEIPGFVGRRIGLTIDTEQQEYNGKIQNRNVVKNMYFLGGMAQVPSDDLNDMLAGREAVGEGEPSYPF